MKIRLLKNPDIKQAAAIVGKNYNKKYQLSAARELKEMFGRSASKPVYFVPEDKNQIVGFAGYIQSWMDYSIYQIFWVNVLPQRQHQGIGKLLVAKVIKEIKKKIGVSLIQLSTHAPSYYSRNFGFKKLLKFTKTYYLMFLKPK